MKRPLALLLASTSLLAGCSLAPPYQRPAPPVPPRVGDAAPAASAEPLAAAPWREFFTDSRLEEVIALALDESRDLRIAALTVERTRARYRIQRSELLPLVGASATAEHYSFAGGLDGSGNLDVEQFSVGVGVADWELDLFGRLRSLKDAALEQYLATEAARTATQVSLVAAVADTWLALAADTAALDVARATVASQEAALELVRQSAEVGMTGDLALRQAESQVEAARADRARLAGLVALDRHALDQVVGAPVPSDLLPAGLDEVAQEKVAAGLPSEVLLRRPDILAAEHRLQAANAVIGAARAAFFPRISLTGSGGTLSTELAGLFEDGSGTWTFAGHVSLPLFTGGALKAGLDTAEVDREIAVAAYERAIQAAFREVADALALRTTLLERQAAQERLVTALEGAYDVARQRYEAGLDGYLDVLVAERSLYAARTGLIAVRGAVQANRVALYTALGGGGGAATRPPAPPEA